MEFLELTVIGVIVIQKRLKTLDLDALCLFQKFNNQNEVTTVLIDTSPDIRNQLLRANVNSMDAVLYTHDHADQSGGIDDLRVFALRKRKRVSSLYR